MIDKDDFHQHPQTTTYLHTKDIQTGQSGTLQGQPRLSRSRWSVEKDAPRHLDFKLCDALRLVDWETDHFLYAIRAD